MNTKTHNICCQIQNCIAKNIVYFKMPQNVQRYAKIVVIAIAAHYDNNCNIELERTTLPNVWCVPTDEYHCRKQTCYKLWFDFNNQSGHNGNKMQFEFNEYFYIDLVVSTGQQQSVNWLVFYVVDTQQWTCQDSALEEYIYIYIYITWIYIYYYIYCIYILL